MTGEATAMNPSHGNPFQRFLLWIAGVDAETLRLSPSIEWGEIYGIATIMLFSAGYQAALFALIAHQIFGDGSFQFTLVLGAIFLASFILVIDRHVIMVSSWHSTGLEDLTRAKKEHQP
jgi:hypothetical protein